MASVSEYPTEGELIVRGDPLIIDVHIMIEGEPVDISSWTWRAQVRPGPDRPLLTSFAISADTPPGGTVPNRLLLELTEEQTTLLKQGMGFDLEQLTPIHRTWWIVTTLNVAKDYSHA